MKDFRMRRWGLQSKKMQFGFDMASTRLDLDDESWVNMLSPCPFELADGSGHIYEDDILKDQEGRTYIVVWKEGQLCGIESEKGVILPVSYLCKVNKIIVWGNIWGNPIEIKSLTKKS